MLQMVPHHFGIIKVFGLDNNDLVPVYLHHVSEELVHLFSLWVTVETTTHSVEIHGNLDGRIRWVFEKPVRRRSQLIHNLDTVATLPFGK